MLPVVLSILLVVLISGAVLWIVGEQAKPTSEGAEPPISTVGPPTAGLEAIVALEVPAPLPPPPPPAAARPRQPATSRRRPASPVAAPAPLAPSRPAVATAPRPAMVTARMTGSPLPRHRFRSGVLMVLLVGLVGVLVALVVAVVLAALAFGLRSAVTS